MDEVKETSEGMFVMKWRNFVVMLGSLIIGTNTFTGLIFNQEQNTLQIEYNKERADRKQKNSIIYERLLDDKEDLEKALNDCKIDR